MNYKNLVEKETKDLIRLRDGKFTSQEFNIFCKANGIRMQLTAAYTQLTVTWPSDKVIISI